MKDLIRALEIFSRYTNKDVVHCEHDVLHICVDEDKISEQDKKELSKLSFDYSSETDSFYSFRFGSC
jgi:hypothetical protein